MKHATFNDYYSYEQNNFYPFGMSFGDNSSILDNPYKYNGKELDRMYGLDLYDYGTRHYDPALGRWGTIDPLAEKYYSISPYAYCANNPIRFIDPDGRAYDPIDDAVNSDRMIGVGQRIGDTEVHLSRGLGVGLGESSGGISYTHGNTTISSDLNIRPGGGAAAAAAVAVTAVTTGGTALVPIGASAF